MKKLVFYRFLLSVFFLFGVCSLKAESNEKEPEISLEAIVNKTGFVGESLEYNVVLKSSIPDISDIRIIDSPNFPVDITVIKGIIRNQRPEQITVKGKKYYKWTVFKDFLIPGKSGKYEISNSRFIAFIPQERIVNDFFWGRRKVIDYTEKYLSYKGSVIKIEDLPQKNRPKDFSGCVGEFSIEGWFPPGEIIVGKEATVVFSISGFGDLSKLNVNNISSIFKTGCSLKEIEREDQMSQKDGRLFSEVSLICRFVPETEDGFISPLIISFFNPEKKKYDTCTSYKLHWDGSIIKKSSGKIEAIEI